MLSGPSQAGAAWVNHAQHTRTPLHPAALASVPYGVVLVRVRVRSGVEEEEEEEEEEDWTT